MLRLATLAVSFLLAAAATAQTVAPWLEGIAAVTDIEELSDGRVLATTLDGLAAYSASGERLGGFGTFPGTPFDAVELRDGRILVVGTGTSGGAATQVYASAGEPLGLFGSAAGGLSALELADGRVLIGSGGGPGGAAVRAYDADGALLATIAEGLDGSVRGLAELPDGRILIAHGRYPGRVAAYAPDTQALTTFAETSGFFRRAVADRDRVYLVTIHDVRAYGFDGVEQGVVLGVASFGTTLTADGRFLVGASGGINAFTIDGTPEAPLVRNVDPRGLAQLADGRVLMLNQRRLEVYSPEAVLLDTLATFSGFGDDVLALRDGRIAVRESGRILLLSEEGTPLDTLGADLFGDGGLAEHPDGRILADNDLWQGDVLAFAPDGAALDPLVEQVYPLDLIALADGRVALLDDDGNAATLYLYSASGESLGVLFSTTEYVDGGFQLRDGRLVLKNPDGAVIYSLDGESLGPLAPGVGSWRGIVELHDGRLLVANAGRVDVVSGIATATGDAPEPTAAVRVAPNPTRGTAALTFRIDAPASVRLTVNDALGREVAVLADGPLAVGEHRADLDARGLAPGVYLWRLTAGERMETGRVTVVR